MILGANILYSVFCFFDTFTQRIIILRRTLWELVCFQTVLNQETQ